MILGQHTLGEVRDLLAAKDYEHARIQAAYDAAPANVDAKDPAWKSDWAAFLDRYKSARLKALAEIAAASAVTVGPALTVLPAEGTWKGILATLTKDPSKPYTDTDEQGLFVRLQKAGVTPDVSHVPQPQSADVDLGIYRGADDLLKGGAAAVSAATNAGTSAVKKNPWPFILGGLAVVGVGYVALRAAVPPLPFRR